MRKSTFGLSATLIAALTFFARAQSPIPTASGADKEDGQWTMPAKNFQGTRYSGLEEINTANAKNLKVAWTFSTGVNRGHEAAPLVVGDTMYVVTPFPNILYALDLKEGGKTKWKYEPQPASAAQGVACCDLVNRGCFFFADKIYFNTLDNNTVCVDAKTGKELWKTKLGEINRGETITMAPLVVKNKVLVGNSGGEFGVRGWLTALDALTGKIAWRAYSTGPDKDCLIGADFKPFYKMDQGKDLGLSTWPSNHWQIGGGTVWGWVTYDPGANLIYYGTANPGAWNPELRPGDNKWSCGVFARDPDTGEAVWYYQWSPHDLFDWDGVNEMVLADLPINGQTRKVLMHADRNGRFYVLDRKTGELVNHPEAFTRNTTSIRVDMKTGKLVHVEEKSPHMGKVIRDIQPFAPGAKDWQPMSFSPRTNTVFLPHQNMAMDHEGTEANYIAGTPYVGANTRFYAGPGGHRGVLMSWDPVRQKKVWEHHENFPVWSGTIVTASDVVFTGTMDGWFKAFHANGDGKGNAL